MLGGRLYIAYQNEAKKSGTSYEKIYACSFWKCSENGVGKNTQFFLRNTRKIEKSVSDENSQFSSL
jgi:hypothetical protein